MVTIKTTEEIFNDEINLSIKDNDKWVLVEEQKKVINDMIETVELTMGEDCPTDVAYHNALLNVKECSKECSRKFQEWTNNPINTKDNTKSLIISKSIK